VKLARGHGWHRCSGAPIDDFGVRRYALAYFKDADALIGLSDGDRLRVCEYIIAEAKKRSEE
jgi:hypothetical protein